MTNEALRPISRDLDAVYSDIGRPSIPPEQLLRAFGTLRKLRHRGVALARWAFTFNAAGYDVVRMRTLLFGSG